MTNEEKYEKLMKIVEQVNEIFPELDKLVVNDLDDPSSVIITSAENLQLIAAELGAGFDSEDELDSYFSDLIEDDDDDKDNLH